MDPGQISRWLDANLWRFDGPEFALGDEPGSARKDWDSAKARMLLAASWPYMQAAGNNSIPVVYRTVNDHPELLCDRFYLPATPRDFRLLARGGLPVFGVESKHSVLDFDVFATSISYTVLFVNFCQYLRVSGIPLRWRDRRDHPGNYPMVMVGGQAWCSPEFMAPVVDCVFLGEAEDAPGNPGIQAVMATIAELKQNGQWFYDRLGCYEYLARTYNFLYFPRFVAFDYEYQDRGLPEPTKMVAQRGHRLLLDGIGYTFKKRYVQDIDAIAPHTEAPLLYSDPGMGAGDIEAAKGCPAWCSFPLIGETRVLSREWGPCTIDWLHHLGTYESEVWDGTAWVKATVESHGVQPVQRITFRPADRGTANGAWRRSPRASCRVQVTATRTHGWELVDGTETHDLRVGDIVPAAAATGHSGPEYDLGWVHGFLFGDGHQRKFSTGERRPLASGSFKVRLFGKDAAARQRFARFWEPGQDDRNSWANRPDLRVSSIGNPDWAKGDAVVYGWAAFDVKAWPSPAAPNAYVEGFLEGWIAADGSLRAKGTSWRVAAQYHPEHHGDVTPAQWLEQHAAQGGWVYVGCSQSIAEVTNYGLRSAPLMEHTLVRPEGHGWCVESIEPLDRAEEVFCFTVPGSHRFSLASGVFTMNCRLTYVEKPYREHSVDYLVKQAEQWRRNMGSNELSPYGPDFPMYTRKKELLGALLENVSDEVDTGAMRVDDFIGDPDYSMLLAFGGTDAVTLGLEGNSQRMRDLVGKGVSDKDVEEAVARAIRAGIRKVKLFMISNMPGEEAGDVMRIVRLGRRLAEIREQMGQPNVRIQFSWTPLLIEAQTPMQWFAPTAPDYTLQKAMEQLREQHIEMKLGDLDERELVLTPDRGMVPIKDLREGDRVVDPDGEDSQVTGVYPQGVNETYRVTWSDGTSAVASAYHLWDVQRGSGKARRLETEVPTWLLRDWLQKTPRVYLVGSPGLAQQSLGRGPVLAQAIDPYLLGLLLGDGCFTKASPEFASADEELLEACRSALPAGIGMKLDYRKGPLSSFRLVQEDGGGSFYPRRENPLTGELRRLGLWGHRAWTKFVPDEYKFAPAHVRLAVLKGLMDTDGTPCRGHANFSSSSQQLRDDVVWLARSLGFVAKARDARGRYRNKAGEYVEARPVYWASVWHAPGRSVFRLLRKASAEVTPHIPRRRLVSVEPEGTAPTTCIAVSARSSRYLAGSGMVPTHNSKAQPNKIALFQACQRASRDAGEAIVDVIDDLQAGSWGGVAQDMHERLDEALKRHGFRNGLEDLYLEMGHDDLFGWEHIDIGVSREHMWTAYQRMVQFLEGTDAESYDSKFDDAYHGSEWHARCDQHCAGNACGVCSKEDLKIRQGYIQAVDRNLEAQPVQPLDQTTVAVKVRFRYERTEKHRFVSNAHWKYAIRRAAYRAHERGGYDMPPIAKRSVRIASDAYQYRDRSAGVDYGEFGFTRVLSSRKLDNFMGWLGYELSPWLELKDWELFPKEASLPRTPVSHWELEVAESEERWVKALRAYDQQEYVKVMIRQESFYSGASMEEANARDHIADAWVTRDRDRLLLRMILNGKLGPYQAYAPLLGTTGWMEAQRFTARRLAFFDSADVLQGSLLRPVCIGCGTAVPAGLLGEVFDMDYCPRCRDESQGTLVAGLARGGV